MLHVILSSLLKLAVLQIIWRLDCFLSVYICKFWKHNYMIVPSTPFRYLLTPCMQKSVENKIKSLNWQEMEKTPCIPEMSDSDYCVRIPGGGITRALYEEG